MKNIMTWTIGITLLFSVILGGCSAKTNEKNGNDSTSITDTTAAKKEKDIVIGAILSTSGNYAALGLPEANALKAFEQTAKPINGRKIRFIIENDQSNPVQAAAAAKTLIANEEVVGIIGPSVVATMLGAFPVLQPAKVPILILTPLPYPNYNKEPFIFGVNQGSLEIQAQAILNYFKSIGIGAKEFAVLANDDASGQSISKIMKSVGIENITLAPTTLTDYSALLTQLKKQGIRGLMNIQSGANAGYTRKSQLAIGYDVPLLIGTNTLNPSFKQIAGEGANGVKVLMLSSIVEPSQLKNPDLAKVVADYQKRLKDSIGKSASEEGFSSAFAWDEALSFYLAAKEAKTIDRPGLQKILDQQEFIGSLGKIKRTPTDHSGFQLESYFIGEVKDDTILVSGK